ncbi:hypothetical protein F2Q69_00022359 [Brassica cretica]|uniref:Uncharacterized protein n=1 Tax=Brassica cretica TaxID=69181 RepID=A0A8S9QN11_BRACR|nr:hypothetical protein F2Q69_00022359 [Brassica cretica]
MCQAKQEAISDVLLVMWEGWTQEGGVFARDKSRSMAKKDETSKEGCSSGRSDLVVDQKASSLEPGHRGVCGTKEKEIKVCEEMM